MTPRNDDTQAAYLASLTPEERERVATTRAADDWGAQDAKPCPCCDGTGKEARG